MVKTKSKPLKRKAAQMSNEEKVQLINLVKKYPGIYDKSLPEAIKKDECWQKIKKKFNHKFDLAQLKQQWTNLRNNYVKKWRINGSKIETKVPANETWFLYSHLMFLQPYLEPVSSSSLGLSSDSETSLTETEYDTESDSGLSDSKVSRKSKRKAKDEDETDDDVDLPLSKKMRKENSNETFAKYIAKELDLLSPKIQVKIKTEIQNSLFYNQENMDSNSAQIIIE